LVIASVKQFGNVIVTGERIHLSSASNDC